MKLIWISCLFFVSAVNAGTYTTSDLRDFYTDGCSDAPDGTWGNSKWLHCCYHHDQKYFAGGTADDRWSADLELAHCIQNASGSETLASLYYFGVRMGGGPSHNTDYRWGYGWPQGRGYAPLTYDEKTWVDAKLDAFDCFNGLNDFTFDHDELHLSCDSR